MGNLDKHTDALLSLFHTKGGNAGQQISDILNMLNQVCDYFVVGLSKVPIILYQVGKMLNK